MESWTPLTFGLSPGSTMTTVASAPGPDQRWAHLVPEEPGSSDGQCRRLGDQRRKRMRHAMTLSSGDGRDRPDGSLGLSLVRVTQAVARYHSAIWTRLEPPMVLTCENSLYLTSAKS